MGIVRLASAAPRPLAILLVLGLSHAACAGSMTNTYDGAGRLTRVVYDDGSVIEYRYDASGRRTSRINTQVGIVPANLVTAVSRKAHGAAGSFDLALGLVPTVPTTEPRSGGAGSNYQIVFRFDKAVTGGTPAVTEGTATVGFATFSGNDVIVDLTGVANQQYVTVSIGNVTASDGSAGGSGAVRVGFLLGDVSGNRVVTVSDLAQVNGQIAQPVSAANFLKDVNASGTLTVGDKGIANTQITKALPAP